MTGVYIAPDDEHGLTVRTFIEGATDAVTVTRPAAGDLLVLTLPVAGARLVVEGPTWALIDWLATAVEAVEAAGPGPWVLVEDEPPAGLAPPTGRPYPGPPPPPRPPSGDENGPGPMMTARWPPKLTTALWWALVAAILVALALALARLGPPPATGPTT